ncbi:hypothetical protein K7B10_37705 [Streptomyces flavotricini]|uniref:Uncharacterized protein n=1 Tax=Streptomyces flavotricini TaxID=66888 RepID=A0ABS8EHJ0_9ACTN|nr:hypothetical protein [Streptomyces flavotricini]MCC0100414.1 hypothetical protein [Streptomyces flavotricini]
MTESPKPAVLPVTVRATSGWLVGAAAAALAHGHLEGLKAAGIIGDFLHDIPAGEQDADFHIRWPVADDVPVRVRLTVRDVPEQGSFRYELTAETARPWDGAWPPPLPLFGPPDLLRAICDPSTVARFTQPNPVPRTAGMRDWLRETSASPSSIGVLVHDGEGATFSDARLLEGLPPGLMGRVLEYRVFGAQRQSVNRLLQSTGVKLPAGGALLLPSRPTGSAINAETLAAKGDVTRDPAPLFDAVLRYASEPRPTGGRALDRVHHLRTASLAGSDGERLSRTQATLEEQRLRREAPTARHAEEQALTRTFGGAFEDALRATRGAEDRERTATGELRDARARFAALATTVRSRALAAALHTVGRCLQAAERDAEAGAELLDAQTVEIVHLRSRPAAPRPASARALTAVVPNNWEELAHQARHACVHLVLADITETTHPLRGHPLEQVWIRRTWQTLATLNSYAAAKTAHGPRLLPHLAAYLRWPDAATLFPATRHAPRESARLMASPRLHEARCFPVPRTIHPSGRVFMGEHVRIGSGRPPAPRLHLYDDTGGRTGQIHIGYIGTHLPSLRTN